MEILGIGPGEFILILIIMLVVVGPERLPELARQAGQMMVRVRNWIQRSPDAAMIMRARQEIEQELAAIKMNLLEVQNVRNEVLDAAKQLEDSVNSIASTRVDLGLDDILEMPTPGQTEAVEEGIKLPLVPELPLKPRPPAETEPVIEERVQLPLVPELPLKPRPVETEPAGAGAVAVAERPALAPNQIAELNMRLQAVMADLWALQEQLKQGGLLNADWQPPSYSMQLPHDTPESPNGQIEEVV